MLNQVPGDSRRMAAALLVLLAMEGTRGRSRMAAEPFEHDAVRLRRRFFEDGVADTRKYDEF